MNKQQLAAQIAQAFTQQGIAFTQGQQSDFEIHTEFVNAGWSTGKKKFRYDVLIRLAEEEKTAWFWQKTTESGAGLSFGCGLETATQSGATSLRKVKIVQYGPEGKVVEVNANLAEIGKAVKRCVKTAGWKFRTALRQDKAKFQE